MDATIVAALISLCGVSLASLFGGVGYYFKTRNEIQKNKCLVLFHLLEIRFLIVSSYVDSKELLESYLGRCEEFFNKKGVASESVVSEDLRRSIEKYFVDHLELNKPIVDECFLQSYEDCLKDLCKTDPLLAYYLRGKGSVSKVLDATHSYIDNSENFLDDESPQFIRDLLSKKINELSSIVLNKLLDELNTDIRKVAYRISVYTWFECFLITRKKIKSTIDLNGLDAELERILAVLEKEVEEMGCVSEPDSINS
ncbi:hypothetical protein [Teredinibacter sp. KSP-S5-2]|uniref:hypothetical protein n=1 Tax=Teredinibacter sp. KSP-S5-2 TaxID=3034506 RepID=UPI0029351054|nr:hypothetical protein [Teredinibacter sp. KSP-S5-2]WNO10505.1 hypothetical protein P5V12_04900 [Teredinibacter sp. KSP-S5-2]